MPDLPAQMYRRGRPVDPEFEPNEQLFLRVPDREHVSDDGKLLPQAIRLPSQSVNRGKYSQPEWVRIPTPKVHVVAIKVDDLPEPWQSDTSALFATNVAHDPLERNYSHSEIRIHKDGKYSEKLRLKPRIKMRLRAEIAEQAVLVLSAAG